MLVVTCAGSQVEQDIHGLLTWVQRPKADFILCPSRLKTEVSEGEGRHSLLSSPLLSQRRWWIEGKEWEISPSIQSRWAGRGAAPLCRSVSSSPLLQVGQGISLFLCCSAQGGTDTGRELQHPCSPCMP